MNAYDLPTSLTIGEVGYSIRSGWRAAVDILMACADPELDDDMKAGVMLQILFPDWEMIPAEHLQEAVEKACAFIDCGQRDDGKSRPKMIDWAQDAPIIIPEINKVSGREVRIDPNIHWWTFFGWFMGIGEGVLSNVLSIRQKLRKGEKLDKWEQEYYMENRAICDLEQPHTAEENEMLQFIMNWLKG